MQRRLIVPFSFVSSLFAADKYIVNRCKKHTCVHGDCTTLVQCRLIVPFSFVSSLYVADKHIVNPC